MILNELTLFTYGLLKVIHQINDQKKNYLNLLTLFYYSLHLNSLFLGDYFLDKYFYIYKFHNFTITNAFF